MSFTAFVFLTAPGIIVAYWLFLRPELKLIPRFKHAYEIADGFWAKVWLLCGKSAVLVFAYLLQFLSWCLQLVDPVAALLGDPDLRQQITEGLQANPKVLGYILMAISFFTIASRVRSIFNKGDDE